MSQVSQPERHRVASADRTPAETSGCFDPGAPEAAEGNAEREQQRSFYEMCLRAVTNRRNKPYEEDTIRAYLDAVISLEAFLARAEFPAGYQALGVDDINAYLADYRARNGQGGTVTKQSNLRVFFAWLAREYQVDNAYLHPDRNRYARGEDPPPVLADELITALLRTTRDERIMHNVRSQRASASTALGDSGTVRPGLPFIGTVCAVLIFARRSRSSTRRLATSLRRIPVSSTRIRAWSRVRARFGVDAEHGPLWISAAGERLLANGIYQMLKRRTVEAGYPASAVHPHLFRHTAAHEWPGAGGLESDLVELMGWKDPTMVYRYTRSHAHDRALRAAAARSFGDRH